MEHKFKKGDYVTWKAAQKADTIFEVDRIHSERKDLAYIKHAYPGPDFSFGGMPFLVYCHELILLKPSEEPLYLFMVSPSKRNWSFSGYDKIMVVSTNQEEARVIGPSGEVISNWPVEGWSDSQRYIQAYKVGAAEPYMKKNEVIMASFINE